MKFTSTGACFIFLFIKNVNTFSIKQVIALFQAAFGVLGGAQTAEAGSPVTEAGEEYSSCHPHHMKGFNQCTQTVAEGLNQYSTHLTNLTLLKITPASQ